MRDDGDRAENQDCERSGKNAEHRHLYVVGFDFFAEIFGRSADHQSRDEYGQNHEDDHSVEAGTDAAENDFAEHDVEQRNHSAERGEGIVHGVHGAAACVGRDGGEECGVGDAEASFFAFHVSAGLQRACGLIAAPVARASDAIADCRAIRPSRRRRRRRERERPWRHQTAQPWRGEPVMRPSV